MTARTLILTGAGGSAATNVAFSLRKDYRLIGVDVNPFFLHLDPYLERKAVVPRCSDPAYLFALNKLIEAEQVDLVWPQPDSEVRALSKNRAQLKARLFMPPDPIVELCQDKNACLARWSKTDLRHEPFLVRDEKDLASLEYPIWLRATQGAGGRLSALCKTFRQAAAWLSYVRENGYPDTLQAEEYLPGKDYCFTSIWKNGELVTSYLRERLAWVGTRSVGAGGTSSLNRIVHSKAANDASVAAIRAVDARPNGVYNVDLKEDVAKIPRPTEINAGRWVTNVLFSSLAAEKYKKPEWNFPDLAVRLAFDEPLPPLQPRDALPEGLYFVKNVDMGCALFYESELPPKV